jgi:hypothetical protein
MQPLRHHYVEYSILRIVLDRSDHDGFPFSLPDLENEFRSNLFQDITGKEIIEAFTRLCPKYLTLGKWVNGGGFKRYPGEISDEAEFFRRGTFNAKRTAETDSYSQQLFALFPQQEHQPDETPKKFGFQA